VDNTLHVGELVIGDGGQHSWAHNQLVITESTGLSKIQVDTLLVLARNNGYRSVSGVIGIPQRRVPYDNYLWRLPADIDIQLGVPPEPGVHDGTQATVEVAKTTNDLNGSPVEGRLQTTSGGELTLNVSSMMVGTWNAGSNLTNCRVITGVVELDNMTSCTGSIDSLRIGTWDGHRSVILANKALVSLPPGEVTAGSIELGESYMSDPDSDARLKLNGTSMPVSGSFVLNNTGRLETIVNGKSAGLDIADGASVTIGNGSIHIVFTAEQDELETGEYWGLRLHGDYRTDLAAMEDAGKLTYDDVAVAPATAGIYFDGTHTIITIKEVWPPTIITQDITVEVESADPTQIVIDAKDVDALANVTTVTRELTHVDDIDSDPETVTLVVEGEDEYELTLTLTAIEGGGQASDTATLTVKLLPEATGDDLTWTGEASKLAAMDRFGWNWGLNWDLEAPPANPTNATLAFANLGKGSSKLDTDRKVRYIDFNNKELAQTIDLDGHTLTIAGEEEGADLSGWMRFVHDAASAEAAITNGTLQIGTPDAASDLLLSNGPDKDSTLEISSQLLLHAETIRLGGYHRNSELLDLSNAYLIDGVLRAQNIILVQGTGGSSGTCRLDLSDQMNLQEIAIAGNFIIGDNRGGNLNVRIGDSTDGWKLPAGTDVNLGVDENTRGLFRIGRVSHSVNDAYFGGAADGVFTAYLSELSVGSLCQSGQPVALLDLREMESCYIDTELFGVGHYYNFLALNIYYKLNAKAYLPQGIVKADALEIDLSDDLDESQYAIEGSLLQLNDTDFTVSTSAFIGRDGTLEANVASTSSGLNLAGRTVLVEEQEVFEPATLEVVDGGVIVINFLEPGATPDFAGRAAKPRPKTFSTHWNWQASCKL